MSWISNAVPTELLAETTDYAEWKTGIRNEGIAFSLRNSTYKINGTIVQGIVAFALGAIGYVTANGDARAVQTEEVKLGIWTVFSLTPAVMSLLSAIPLFFYDLVGEKRARMFRELEARRTKIQ